MMTILKNTIITQCFFFIFSITTMYFLCQKNIHAYWHDQKSNVILSKKILFDQTLQKTDALNQAQIQAFQKKNTILYQHFFEIKNMNSLSTLLSTTIKSAGFSIQQVTPAVSIKNTMITVTAQGNFFNLLNLIAALRKINWPINIQTLQIEHSIYTITFLSHNYSAGRL